MGVIKVDWKVLGKVKFGAVRARYFNLKSEQTGNNCSFFMFQPPPLSQPMILVSVSSELLHCEDTRMTMVVRTGICSSHI